MVWNIARWLCCIVFVISALGASLVSDYFTTATATLLALFFTFSADEIRSKTKTPYGSLLFLLLILFFMSFMAGALMSGA